MRIKSTLAWATLMLASVAGGWATGGQDVTWHNGHDGTYGVYAGPLGAEYDASRPTPTVALWACPGGVPDLVTVVLACPVDMTPATIRRAGGDARDGDALTPGMVDAVAEASPGTDPATCRAVVGDTTVITCADGTVITS